MPKKLMLTFITEMKKERRTHCSTAKGVEQVFMCGFAVCVYTLMIYVQVSACTCRVLYTLCTAFHVFMCALTVNQCFHFTCPHRLLVHHPNIFISNSTPHTSRKAVYCIFLPWCTIILDVPRKGGTVGEKRCRW